MRAGDAALQCLDLGLELLDDCMALLQILVEAVALRDELLLPLAETLLLHLDLLCEALAKSLLLLLELGIIQLPRPSLAKLPRLHLLCPVGLVVVLLRRVNQVEHVRADQNGAELLKVAVLLVFDLGNTPGVLATLDSTAIRGRDVLLGANDGEGHGSNQAAGVLETGLIILLKRGLVDLDALGLNDRANLRFRSVNFNFQPIGTREFYLRLKLGQIGGAEGIGLSDNGDKVDASAEALHDLNIQRLQGVASGADEVEASVDAEVDLLGTLGLLLLKHVRLMLVVQELDDGLPRVAVVDIVAEARGVNDRKADYKANERMRAFGRRGVPLY